MFSRVLLLQEQYGSLTNKTLASLQVVTSVYEPHYIFCNIQKGVALAGAVWQLDEQDPGILVPSDKPT